MVLSFARGLISVRRAGIAALLCCLGLGCSAEKDELTKELDRLRAEVASLRSQTSALSERVGSFERVGRASGGKPQAGGRGEPAAGAPATQESDRPALAVVKLGPTGDAEVVTTEPAPAAIEASAAAETSLSLAAFEKGKKLFDRRQLDPALLALNEFLQSFPDHDRVPEATFMRAQVHALKGDKKRAAEQLEAALAMSGGTDMAADVLFELAKAKDKLGDPAGAKRARDRLKTEYSNSSAAKRLAR